MSEDPHLRRELRRISAVTDAIVKRESLDQILHAILKGVLAIFSTEDQQSTPLNCAVSICAYDAARPEMFHFVHEAYAHEGTQEIVREHLQKPLLNGYTYDNQDHTKKPVGTEMYWLKEDHLTLPHIRHIHDVVKHWPASAPRPKSFAQSGVGAATYIPLQVGKPGFQKTVGMITIYFAQPRTLTPGEEAELKFYAKQAAIALYHEELIEKNQLEEQRLEELEKLIQDLEDGATLEEIASRAAGFALHGALEEQSARHEKRFTAHQCDFDGFVLYVPKSITGFDQEVFLLRPQGDNLASPLAYQSDDPDLPSECNRAWLVKGAWSADGEYRRLRRPGWLAALGYALVVGDQEVGAFYVSRSEEKVRILLGLERDQEIGDEVHPFLPEEHRLLADLAKELAILIEEMDRQTRQAKKARISAMLGQAILEDAALSLQTRNPDAVCAKAWETATELLASHFAHEQGRVLELKDKAIRPLKVFRGGKSRSLDLPPPYQHGAHRDLADYVFSKGETLFLPDVEESIRKQHLEGAIDTALRLPLSYLGVPVMKGDQVYAVIEVEHSNEHGALQETDRGVVEGVAAWMSLMYAAKEG